MTVNLSKDTSSKLVAAVSSYLPFIKPKDKRELSMDMPGHVYT